MKHIGQFAIVLVFLFDGSGLRHAAAQTVINPATNGATNVIRRSARPAIPVSDDPAFQQLIARFGDASVSRPQLLAETEAFLKQFPDSVSADRARQTAATLGKMITEDEAHAQSPPPDLEKLPVTNRVAELIFRLRDQNGCRQRQYESGDIFDDVNGSSNTPAHLLVAIGYPAVPQLIAALADPAPTRSVIYWHNFGSSRNQLLNVGDCALQIIWRISGMRFPFVYGSAAEARPAVEAWFADFSTLGEKGMLIRETEAGSHNSYDQAKILLERYPDAAAEPIIKGVEAVKTMSLAEAGASFQSRWPHQTFPESALRSAVRGSEAPRSQLLGLLADSNLKNPAITEFFSRELKEAPDLSSRIAAASGLSRRGDQTGVTAMIREWPKVVQAQTDHPSEVEAGFDLFALQNFLGAADSPEAIKALVGSLPQLGASERHGILSSIAPNHGNDPSETGMHRSRATLAVIEEVLVSALNDTEAAQGTLAYLGGQNYPDIRICDEAGCYLAYGWPERYQFDASASRKVHERQRVQCLNVWRAAHKQRPLPLPAEPANHVSGADSLKITSIEWETNGAKPSAAFVARMEALKNKLLTVDLFKATVEDYQANPEPGSSGLDLQALKDEDLTGVTILVRLLPGTTPDWRGWGYYKRVTVGTDDTYHNGSSGPVGMLSDLVWNANRAISAPPTTPFLIQATVTSFAYKQR